MRKTIVILSSAIVLLLMIVIIFSKSNDPSFITKERVIKSLEENYTTFDSVVEKIEGKNGYFYAQFIKNKLDISTDIEELLDGGKLKDEAIKKNVEFIINELKFQGIYKDKTSNSVTFEREQNAGGHGIIFSRSSEPESMVIESIGRGWYYYLWYGE